MSAFRVPVLDRERDKDSTDLILLAARRGTVPIAELRKQGRAAEVTCQRLASACLPPSVPSFFPLFFFNGKSSFLNELMTEKRVR